MVSGQLGDRVERAIEERAGVDETLERADAGPRHDLRRRVLWLAVTGVSLYLVAPSVIEVLGSYADLERIAPGWLAAMVVAQAAALVPIWGWGPRVGAGHMNPSQAAEAVARLAPAVAIPIHWGTYLRLGLKPRHGHLLRDPADAFREQCAAAAPGVRVVLLQPGETHELGAISLR